MIFWSEKRMYVLKTNVERHAHCEVKIRIHHTAVKLVIWRKERRNGLQDKVETDCWKMFLIFKEYIMHSGGLFLSPSILASPPSQGSQWCFNALSRQLQVPFYFSQWCLRTVSLCKTLISLCIHIFIHVCYVGILRCLVRTKIKLFTISHSWEENLLSIVLAPNTFFTAAFGHRVLIASVYSSQAEIKGAAVLHHIPTGAALF